MRALGQALAVLRGVVLGVLRQIAVLPGVSDLAHDAGPLGLEPAQLTLETLVPLGRH